MHRVKNIRKEIMLGQNNPMAIEHWSDKMEFQGRGAAHIHGVAWCNLQEVAKELNKEDRDDDSDEEFEKDNFEQDVDLCKNGEDEDDDSKSFLEKAFEKLRIDEKLNKKEEKALIAFADKFVTCTLNPDTAAKMMNETASASEGLTIVKIAKETQRHHHTKTCKKHSPDCRFGMPRYPMWKTIITKPLKGETEEERSDRRIKHKEVLKKVCEVFENADEMDQIWKDYDKQKETKDEYVTNRKERILKVL